LSSPRVAAVPVTQKIPASLPPLTPPGSTTTDESEATVSEVGIRKTNTGLMAPPASRESVPSNAADDENVYTPGVRLFTVPPEPKVLRPRAITGRPVLPGKPARAVLALRTPA